MERFSCQSKIKIEFSDVSASSLPDSSRIKSCIEGKLTIYIDKILFFDEEDILLVELAQQLYEWRESDKNTSLIDFRYSSMDYEEENIIAFLKTDNRDGLRVFSVWQKFKSESNINMDNLDKEIDSFLTSLSNFIITKFSFDIRKYVAD